MTDTSDNMLRVALLVTFFLFTTVTHALDNGIRLPPLGWSSWYGYTSNIDEALIKGIGNGMVVSRTLRNGSVTSLLSVGFRHVWIDDGFALPRDNVTQKIIVDPQLFPSGFRNLSDTLHIQGLLFGVYTSKGPLTCLAYQAGQPKRPGSCGFEQIDADTYANDWQVDQVKDDGCGDCSQHDPFIAMRDALNATGRHILYTIHGDTTPGSDNGTVANMWRTGGDLYSSSFDMWTNRLDLATASTQYSLVGPGSLPDPDFLEVGYSPRSPPGGQTQCALEQRSMFTMWAALPTGLILSADIRVGSNGIDLDTLETLTNTEVIAINQDPLVAPMRCLYNISGLQVWVKPLFNPNTQALVFFNRGVDTTGPIPTPPQIKLIEIDWSSLGYAANTSVAVRDLWASNPNLGVFQGSFQANVTQRDARIYMLQVN